MDKIYIYQFTDPTCVWSWGNEPEMRAIEYLYGDKVEIRYITGGLVEDISTLFPIEGTKSEIIKEANKLLSENWLTASAKHGMPVVVGQLQLYNEQYRSSFPQNIAYHAVRRINPNAARYFLRRMREATFTESRRTSQIDILIELAEESGIEAAKFIESYTDGESQTYFIDNRMKCRRLGISGFPSYMIKEGSTYIILGGYQHLNTFHNIISRLSKGHIKPRRLGPSIANIVEFIKHFHRVYPKEIEVTFNIDTNQCKLMVGQLIENGRLHAVPIGNSAQLSISLVQSRRTKVAQSERSKSQVEKQKSSTKTISKIKDKQPV